MITNLTLIAVSAGRGIQIARSSDSEWAIETVLSNQDVRCIAVHPDDPTHWVLGTQGNGVFKTADSGASWVSAGLEEMIIKSVGISTNAIYAGTKPAGVFASSDGGGTWTESESFNRIPGRRLWWSPAESPGTAYVQSLAISPTDPSVLMAGIEFGAVVRSTDAGETWSRHIKGSLRDCHTLKFHSSDGSWAYEAGGTGGGASVSNDGGTTWSKVKEGLDRHYGVACAADPDQPDLWFVSVSPGPRKAPLDRECASTHVPYSAGRTLGADDRRAASAAGLNAVWPGNGTWPTGVGGRSSKKRASLGFRGSWRILDPTTGWLGADWARLGSDRDVNKRR